MKKYSLVSKKLFNTYGSTYTLTDLIVTVIIFCFSVGLVCYFQRLNLMYSAFVILTVLCMLPLIISAFFKYKYEKKRFEEYCLYFESVKMFFKTYKKLIKALQETYKLFDENSEMAKCIKKALFEIENSGDYQKALNYIDEKYHNTYLERLHSLLMTGENQGSDSVYYNLDGINYQDWKDDINIFQKRKKSTKLMFYVMGIITLIISVYTIVALSSDKELIDSLVTYNKYQIYTFIEIELILLLFIYVYVAIVNKKWLRSDE